MRVTILRLEETDTHTLGVVAADGKLVCCSLELPWRGNERSVSSIPFGSYRAKRWESPSRGVVWRLEEVPGRSDILIHVGNTVKDTTGCVLVGMHAGYLRFHRWVHQSRTAFEAFMEATEEASELEIMIWSMKV